MTISEVADAHFAFGHLSRTDLGRVYAGCLNRKGRKMATQTNEVKEGIYFGLPEDEYHPDEALGSGDMRKLRTNPADWWWESPLNPHRPPDTDTPAKLRGRAMHTLVLDGKRLFDRRYMRGPDHTEEMTAAEKGALTKSFNAEAKKAGKRVLPSEAYDRIVIASAMIAKNPHLATAFSGGAPEVSVFWERDGDRRKARFDYLKPRGIGDLKSITNMLDLPFPQACRRAFAIYNYEIQAAHYLEARTNFLRFVKAGQVYPEDGAEQYADLLNRCASEHAFAFQWVFFQADGAPVTWSTILSPNNPIFEIGQREIEVATDNFKRYLDKFGRGMMWLLEEEAQELDMSELPAWWGRG